MSAFCNFANMTTTRTTTSSAAAATNTKTSAVTKAMLGFKKSIDFGRQFRSLATLTAIN